MEKKLDDEASNNLEPVIAQIKNIYNEINQVDGVLGIRPGFSEQGDPTNPEPVIVVVTDPSKEVSNIPAAVNGINVEVRKATALEQLEGILPLSAWETETFAEAAPNINYEPPDESIVSLQEMKVTNITCHIGPDSGWSTLNPFLKRTKESLTVAMYEFYADHIIETITELGKNSNVKLDMILQVDKNDKTIEQTLADSFGDRLNFVPASVRGPHRLFNNSYHTKVAVRDSKEVWMSSGNWSPNSQPLIKAGTQNTLYRNGNREWHVIIKDEAIAELYEKFIRYDMEKSAEALVMEAAPVMPDLLIPEALLEAEAVVIQEHPFNAETFADDGEKVKIKPLMSPDNYAQQVLELIQSAKKSLYLQFSYINQPSTFIFDKIIDAVAKKMKDGLDVKVIAGTSQKAEASDLLIGKRKWKRSMFRIQKTRLHNKGIIVDGNKVAVGSNNWSSDGTQFNRDTTIIFFSKPIADYYSKVFLFDWNNLTRPVGAAPEIAPVLAPETGPTPPGMVRIPWSSWYNE